MTRAEKIQAAFEKHGSDKAIHGYAQFYADHLPENPKSILEIGVKEGASIKAWKELFPEAIIHGLDLFAEFEIPQIEGAYFWKGNQLDYRILEQLRKLEFDVIVEDSSHNCRDHWLTLYALIDSCKSYFIEDLHTCREPFYQQGLNFEHTVLGSIHSGKFPFHHALHNDKIVSIWG